MHTKNIYTNTRAKVLRQTDSRYTPINGSTSRVYIPARYVHIRTAHMDCRSSADRPHSISEDGGEICRSLVGDVEDNFTDEGSLLDDRSSVACVWDPSSEDFLHSFHQGAKQSPGQPK